MLEKMKIVFLDIDGVLNVIPQGEDRYGSIFHREFVDNLKYIIDKTDAKIVITSTWRYDGLDTMKQMWKDRNLPGEVIDITPNEVFLVKKIKLYEYYDEVDRGHEIKYWLDNHDDIENYVILDDDSDMLDEQKAHNFVRCSGNRSHPDSIDMGYGLTRICAEKAVSILGNKN